MPATCRFILQAIHPDYACPEFEMMFETERLHELQGLLGPDAQDDPEIDKTYWLESSDLLAVSRCFGLVFHAGERDVVLFKYGGRGDVPYLIHTNYELLLMLDGRKKFAHMYYEYPPDRHPYEDRFDRYVAQGLLHKEVDIEKFGQPHRTPNGRLCEGVRTAYYTPIGEEWRIRAWRLLERARAKGGWNYTLERLEGMLYGYEDWQNDWWIERLRSRQNEFGTLLVYKAVTEAELGWIEQAGYRAFPPSKAAAELVTAFDAGPDDDETLSLMGSGSVALARFRVNASSFLALVGDKQSRSHQLPGERLKDLNRLILGEIEIVARRTGSTC